MNTNPSTRSAPPGTPKPPRRSPGRLPPPPAGASVMKRDEAAAFLGVPLGTFGTWEKEGRVTIPRYRPVGSAPNAVVYAAADLSRLREEFRKLGEPYADPDRVVQFLMQIRTPTGPRTIDAVPVADPSRARRGERIVLTGEIPDPAAPPSGCRFRTRCWRAEQRCADEVPELVDRLDSGRPVACHFAGELLSGSDGPAGGRARPAGRRP